MANSGFESVEDYIAAQPEAAQGKLRQVRNTIRKALPNAGEMISYKIPTYKMHGNPVLYFAGWKRHYSLYPATEGVLAAFKEDLAPYEINKGTIRFPLSEPIPVTLIEGIAKLRAREVTQGEKAKTKTAKPKNSVKPKKATRSKKKR
jgi:uncharacterized protein YdhG (YjbR/CyaY superfamily)